MGSLSNFSALSTKAEFGAVYGSAKKWHCDFAVVYFLESDQLKFSAVASKKVGKAVKRNRAKRLLRAAFLAVNSDLKSGFYIFIAKAGIFETDYVKIVKTLRWSLGKIGAFR